jgi:hypothetical protein
MDPCLGAEKSAVTKTVRPMMFCGWLERVGYCEKFGLRGLLLLKTKRFLWRSVLLSEVPFGAQNAIE